LVLTRKSTDPVEKLAWLGPVPHSSDEPGALIELVHPCDPAKRAGLQRGDVIVQIDGENASSVDEAVAQIAKHGPGATVNTVVRREGKDEAFKVTLGRASEALSGLPRRLPFPWNGNGEIKSLLPNELEETGENAQLKELVLRPGLCVEIRTCAAPPVDLHSTSGW
jgi:C-terminal processing protease CtpA/Prc